MKPSTWLRPLAVATVLVTLAVVPTLADEKKKEEDKAPPPPRPARCSTEVYRHFDFWIGTWEVRGKTRPDGPHGKNIITAEHGGCVIRENYTAGRYNGSSLNYVDSTTGRWHQTWVDNQGFTLQIQGGLDKKGRMVLESDPTKSPIQRIRWTPMKNGNVRQHWQQSQDGGASWVDVFDGTYVKLDG